jgi:nitroimidazol reductase NimA-like FMN-containing flavoprotein (pyridoxamine 5'-phosphate oxidase superfamily)
LLGQNLHMTDERGPITVLSDDESWNLLKSAALGRLVTHIGDQLEIFPVNFVTQHGTLLFRTAEGTKLFGAVMNDKVLFEVDDHTVAEGWSVVIRGTAHVLTASDEIHEADRAQLLPWVATEKLRYVRITPNEMSGRRFVFGPEPEHGSYPG